MLGRDKYLWIWIFCIFALGIYIQTKLYLHQDVSWLMHAAERMLAGGTYSKNFFDPDPPMIFYWYFIPVILSHTFSLSFMISLRIFMVVFSLISLWLCYRVMPDAKKILIPLAILFMILPIIAFGQREHLFVVLVMPYLFLVATRVESRAVDIKLALAIGLLAGLGFAIKPFFLLIFVMVEWFGVLRYQKHWRILRPETQMIFWVALIYAITVPLLFPDYLQQIVPHTYQFFFAGQFFKLRAGFLVVDIYLFLITTMVLYFVKSKSNSLEDILLIACLSSFGIFWLQGGALLYYHVYPMFVFGLLLLSYLYLDFLKILLVNINKFYFSLAASLLFIFIFGPLIFTLMPQIFYHAQEKQAGSRQQIIQLMQSKPYQQCYFITAFHMAYPMVDYAGLKADSRFYNFASLSILLDKQNHAKGMYKKTLQQESEYLFQEIMGELTSIKPDLIFVDKMSVPGFTQIVNRLKTDTKLREFWQQYQFLQTLAIYDIYERKSFRS